MAGHEEIPTNNGAVLNISQIIRAVMPSAAEAEIGALFINGRLNTANANQTWIPATLHSKAISQKATRQQRH